MSMSVELRTHLKQVFETLMAQHPTYEKMGVTLRSMAREVIRYWAAHEQIKPRIREDKDTGIVYHRYFFTWEMPGMPGKTIEIEYEMDSGKVR